MSGSGARFLERAGASVCYEVHGDGPGVPLVLTHGFSSSREMWRGNLEALSAGRQVVIWDLPGHGETRVPPDPAQYSEATAVGHLTALLDVCDIDRAVVGGLSLGGYLTLAFDLVHPERAVGLLLADTGPGYKRDEGRERWNRGALRQAERFEQEGNAALSGSPETRRGSHDPAGLALAARHLMTQRDSRVIDSLPEIDVPVLVVVGEDDEPFRAAADYMAAKIPEARLVVVPGAGHAVNIDQPVAFEAAADGFFRTLD